MNETFLLYALTRLNGIGFVLTFFSLIGVGVLLTHIICTCIVKEELSLKVAGPYWKPLALCVVMALLVPSKDDAIFIIAGTGVIEAAKTDSAKRIAGKSVAVIEKYLDSALK